MKYMTMIFIDSNNHARLTDVGAEFESDAATVAAFESARSLDIGVEKADFILDLCADNDDIIDSIAVSAESYTEITGEPVLSEDEYIAIDDKLNAELLAA